MDPFTSIVGLAAVLSVAAWSLARLVRSDGSNGTFLRYHPDLGWPHGVQEDDDLRWSWERDPAPRVLQPVGAGGPVRRTPTAPLKSAPLRLAATPTEAVNAQPGAEIVESHVRPVTVARVRRRD